MSRAGSAGGLLGRYHRLRVSLSDSGGGQVGVTVLRAPKNDELTGRDLAGLAEAAPA